jgi:membrane-associated protease RseP (regulator of RpoE activity)
MKISTFRFPRVGFAAAIIVVSASAPLSADEPAAKDAQPQQTEQATPGSEQQALTVSLARGLLFVTNADSLIGVEVIPVDDVLRSHLGVTQDKGLTVTSVSAGAAAAQAGIQPNDVLVAIGEQEIAGAEGLHQSLQASLDKPVSLAYIRGGQRHTVEVTPRSGAALALRGSLVARAEEPKYWLGVGLANADDTLRSQLGVPAGEGLVVTGVENDSPSFKSGVMVNDLLLKLDGKPLKTIEDLAAQLQEIADRSVALELLRRGKPASLTVVPEKRPRDEMNLWAQSINFTYQQGTAARLAIADNRPWSGLVFYNGKTAPPDLAEQVSALLEQAKQLQASLEALQAALRPQPAGAAGEEEQK